MTVKLVRMLVDGELVDRGDFRLPFGYEIVWHREDQPDWKRDRWARELLIKGEFPDVYPDCAEVSCRISIADTLMNEIVWDWLWYPPNARIHGALLSPAPVPYRVSLPQ